MRYQPVPLWFAYVCLVSVPSEMVRMQLRELTLTLAKVHQIGVADSRISYHKVREIFNGTLQNVATINTDVLGPCYYLQITPVSGQKK